MRTMYQEHMADSAMPSMPSPAPTSKSCGSCATTQCRRSLRCSHHLGTFVELLRRPPCAATGPPPLGRPSATASCPEDARSNILWVLGAGTATHFCSRIDCGESILEWRACLVISGLRDSYWQSLLGIEIRTGLHFDKPCACHHLLQRASRFCHELHCPVPSPWSFEIFGQAPIVQTILQAPIAGC